MELSYIDSARVGVVGDFCADIYWDVDMTKSELSLETPNFAHPVTGERIYPGAAGNVAVNLMTLGVKKLSCCGVVGEDWRAGILKKALSDKSIDVSGFISDECRFTSAYCKPILHVISGVTYEDSRIDFENFAELTRATEDKLLGWLDANRGEFDVLCVCDQLRYGVITAKIREKLSELAKNGLTVIADSRYRAGLYRDIILKPNEKECHLAVHGQNPEKAVAPGQAYADADELSRRTGCKILLTLGENGSAFIGGDELIRCEAVKVSGTIDVCGAGDAYFGAFAAMTAGGADVLEAMEAGSRSAASAVKKLGVTGNPTRAEILRGEG